MTAEHKSSASIASHPLNILREREAALVETRERQIGEVADAEHELTIACQALCETSQILVEVRKKIYALTGETTPS